MESQELRPLPREIFAGDRGRWKIAPERVNPQTFPERNRSGFATDEIPPHFLGPPIAPHGNLYRGGFHHAPDASYADDYDDEYAGGGGGIYGRDSLAGSLGYFLGDPEEYREAGHHGEEIDFGDIWELDAVRQMGKKANIPQYLVDSVDPEADENLLELMVRIAENPEKWRSIHTAMQRLDEASSKREKSSYGRKGIEKRSSTYENVYEYHPRPKGRSMREKTSKPKKKKKKHFGSGADLPRQHARRSEEKIRHGSYLDEYFEDGERPRSAAYASIVFPDNENENFERWRVSYQPVEPEDFEGGVPKDYKHPRVPARTGSDYDRYAKKKLKMKSAEKNAKEAREKEGNTGDDRWKVVETGKDLVDKWSKANDIRKTEPGKEEKGKENAWATTKDHKENWPHFAYHRVTSSPGVQQRDAGAQPRHRSAYVAVSVVPANSTVSGVSSAKKEKVGDPPQEVGHSFYGHDRNYEEKTKSLIGVQEKYHMGEAERLRLMQVMRDANTAPNATTPKDRTYIIPHVGNHPFFNFISSKNKIFHI